ncbi:unnamed protein product [Spirodela intermedia]|uniref:Homeobox-leucine zipper protein n=1 Tax=Spirodela intermedia TaxID=51605 RepID=A0A7I8KBN8_SPIIN|nr:unnamed protein product [Spirodela intermedia]
MRCDGMASPFFPPNFLLQVQTPAAAEHQHHQHHQQPPSLSSLLPPTPCSGGRDFPGTAALLGRRSVSFSGAVAEEVNGEDDLSDEFSPAGEKKRRLNVEQVRTLERNFEMGNRLEPERKVQLARALGLQPRQVAIWFQNRRARWKTKQLEKDYDALKRQVDAIREENRSLQSQNQKLEAEIMAMRVEREAAEPVINLNKETEGSCSNSSDVNLDTSRTPAGDSRHDRPLLQQLPSRPELPFPKTELGAGHDEGFCNVFCGLDDQPAFWAWPEQHSFH